MDAGLGCGRGELRERVGMVGARGRRADVGCRGARSGREGREGVAGVDGLRGNSAVEGIGEGSGGGCRRDGGDREGC